MCIYDSGTYTEIAEPEANDTLDCELLNDSTSCVETSALPSLQPASNTPSGRHSY